MACRVLRQDSTAPFETESLDRFDGAIESHPGHDLGVGELPTSASNLPYPFVGLLPDRFEVFQKFELDHPVPAVLHEAMHAALIQGVDHFAIDIELQLVGGSIADSDRLRILVAGQIGQRQFRHAPLAPQTIEDLHRGGIAPPIARSSQVRHRVASV